jgi:hypothetical protein
MTTARLNEEGLYDSVHSYKISNFRAPVTVTLYQDKSSRNRVQETQELSLKTFIGKFSCVSVEIF